MRPANDPSIDYKRIVQEGYDRCAAAYEAARRGDSTVVIQPLVERLNARARVLDVGCGTGIPVARELSLHFEVVGVDLSSEMIRRARDHVPAATFIHSDIMLATFPVASFDAVVAIYSIFHLPREEHRAFLQRVHRWLKPGGCFLATVSEDNEAPYTEADFFGTTMYWSNYGLQEYAELFRESGFEIVESGHLGHGYTEDQHVADENHPLILAQKTTS